jgi:hypothetical protein
MSVILISMRYVFGFLCGSAVLATILNDRSQDEPATVNPINR